MTGTVKGWPARLARAAAPLGIAAALSLAAASPPAWAQGAPGGPPSVSVAKPLVKEIIEWDDFIGRFEAVDNVDVRARVSGYLEKVHFEDGAVVKPGDLLFTIDQRPYRAALQEAAADVAAARARQDYAAADLRRADSLRRGGNVAEQVFDQRRQNLQTSRADIDRAEAALARAKLDMGFTEIRAPIGGRVSRRLVSPGALIKADDTILTNIVSLDPIQFYFDVDERSFLSYLRDRAADGSLDGDAADVFVTLTNEREGQRRGRIDFIDNRLDQASGTMRGRAVFQNKDNALVPGLFGRIRLASSPRHPAVLIPDEAIGTDQDRRIVYVVDKDNKVAARTIRTGPRADGLRVVREGLKAEDTIVVGGLSRVRPGAQVQPRPTEIVALAQRSGS